MPESCTVPWRCGTLATGWLNGCHPSVADGAVTRQVCFSWAGNCCFGLNNIYINVRNCGGFYVYRLKPLTACSYRYCGNGLPYTPVAGRNYISSLANTSFILSIEGGVVIQSPVQRLKMGLNGTQMFYFHYI